MSDPNGTDRGADFVGGVTRPDGAEPGRDQLVIGVVGLGAVGIPLAAMFAHARDTSVLLYDNDDQKLDALARGEIPLAHLDPNLGDWLLRNAEVVRSPTELSRCNVLIICVPTPLDERREPDLSAVVSAGEMIAAHVRQGALVVLESTTWPGTTRRVLAPLFDKVQGVQFAYSPERVDPGRVDPSVDGGDPLGRSVPKLVGGLTEAATARAVKVYKRAFHTVVPTRASEVAEAAKLVENVYRAVNIALVGELKIAFDAMGIDIWEVLDAAETKPFGFTRFDPGPGMGGHCLPIDPFYLAWAAKQAGAEARFVELSGEINRAMPQYVVRRTVEALASRGIDPNGASILLIGVAYKRGVDIIEESPAFPIAEELSRLGVDVEYCDPLVRVCSLGASVRLDEDADSRYAAAIVLVEQVGVDLAPLVSAKRILVVDTRAALREEMGSDPRYVPA